MHGLTFKGEKIIFMENDITNLVQSMITGGVRGALGELAIRGIDEAHFIQIYASELIHWQR